MAEDDDRDVVNQQLHERIFSDVPFESPLDLPGAGEQDKFRDIFEQMQSTNAGAFAPDRGAGMVPGMPPGKQPLVLSPLEQAKANALRDLLLKMIRSTNITAAQPAHNKPMLWSEVVDLSAVYTLPAAAGAYTTVVTYTVPNGRWMRINGYGVDVSGGFTYDGSILWNIQVNGLQVNTLGDWGVHRGTIAIPRQTYIIVKENQRIDFQVKRATAAGGTNDVTMMLKGYMWLLRKTYDGTKASITAY